jgi:hypothetical protein
LQSDAGSGQKQETLLEKRTKAKMGGTVLLSKHKALSLNESLMLGLRVWIAESDDGSSFIVRAIASCNVLRSSSS